MAATGARSRLVELWNHPAGPKTIVRMRGRVWHTHPVCPLQTTDAPPPPPPPPVLLGADLQVGYQHREHQRHEEAAGDHQLAAAVRSRLHRPHLDALQLRYHARQLQPLRGAWPTVPTHTRLARVWACWAVSLVLTLCRVCPPAACLTATQVNAAMAVTGTYQLWRKLRAEHFPEQAVPMSS